MFTPESFIDAVQNTKRVFTNTVITDKTLNKVANEYIDSQTVFVKTIANNALEMTKYSTETITNFMFPKKA